MKFSCIFFNRVTSILNKRYLGHQRVHSIEKKGQILNALKVTLLLQAPSVKYKSYKVFTSFRFKTFQGGILNPVTWVLDKSSPALAVLHELIWNSFLAFLENIIKFCVQCETQGNKYGNAPIVFKHLPILLCLFTVAPFSCGWGSYYLKTNLILRRLSWKMQTQW